METKKRIGWSILCACMIFLLSSCRMEEDEVQYNFIIHNATETPITIELSSWGAYHVYIDGMYDSRHKFSESETISPNNNMQFSQIVGDNPNPHEIPSSVVPAWEYITAMKCGGVSIPRSFFTDRANFHSSKLLYRPGKLGNFCSLSNQWHVFGNRFRDNSRIT